VKRITVSVPDDLALRLRHEARRRRVSVAEVVREAVEQHLPAAEGQPLSFFAIGEGGPPDASERVDEFVDEAMKRHRKG
jgi:hypothetical protein